MYKFVRLPTKVRFPYRDTSNNAAPVWISRTSDSRRLYITSNFVM